MYTLRSIYHHDFFFCWLERSLIACCYLLGDQWFYFEKTIYLPEWEILDIPTVYNTLGSFFHHIAFFSLFICCYRYEDYFHSGFYSNSVFFILWNWVGIWCWSRAKLLPSAQPGDNSFVETICSRDSECFLYVFPPWFRFINCYCLLSQNQCCYFETVLFCLKFTCYTAVCFLILVKFDSTVV